MTWQAGSAHFSRDRAKADGDGGLGDRELACRLKHSGMSRGFGLPLYCSVKPQLWWSRLTARTCVRRLTQPTVTNLAASPLIAETRTSAIKGASGRALGPRW